MTESPSTELEIKSGGSKTENSLSKLNYFFKNSDMTSLCSLKRKHKYLLSWVTFGMENKYPEKIMNCIPVRYLTENQVSTVIKPIYTKVHPDLFGHNPKAQHINEISLKRLLSHLDALLNKRNPKRTTLQFFVKEENGELESIFIDLFQTGIKTTLQNVLKSFKLPLTPLSNIVQLQESEKPASPDRPLQYDFYTQELEVVSEVKPEKLYDWLVKNMWKAEVNLKDSVPIRKDIARLKQQLHGELGITEISSVQGTATTRIRGCLHGLLELYRDYPAIKSLLFGRSVHFGNVTGVNLAGNVVLGTAEVRSQWLSFLQQLPDVDSLLSRIPDMQKAVSIGLKDIQITHRKFGGSVVARAYGHDLRRLVTSLNDYRGKYGLPSSWPESLSHLQLVVEPAWGPMMLSPSGQLLVPSSCPPSQIISFITEKLHEAPYLLLQYELQSAQEILITRQCQDVFKFGMFEKDDSVLPDQMINFCERIIAESNNLLPLLSGAHVYVTRYYSVMLDGEICLPWNWDIQETRMAGFSRGSG